jgi:malate dehydrogenase (oxaloacetate-decarboxylating)
MQGTGAMNLAAVLSAVKASGSSLGEQRIVVFGAGTAGTRIADQLRDALAADGLTRDEAIRRFWAMGRRTA